VAEYYAHDGRGHPWVKSSELRDRYVRDTAERISDRGLRESAAKMLPADTVLVAMYGATAARVGLLKAEAAVNQAVCALILDEERAHSVFVFHALRSAYGELAGRAAGAAQQNLNAGIIRSFRIPVPDHEVQVRIAAVLGAFDELIELNERRIELLEGIASSLYREWFERFRFPDHGVVPSGDAVPEGWRRTPATQLFVINPRLKTTQDVIAKVAMADVDERTSAVFPSDQVRRPAGSRFARDDVLLARITPCLENGKTALVKFLEPGEIAVGSTEFIVLRGACVGPAFTYCAARSNRLREHAIKSMSGATGRQRVAMECFDSLELPEPPRELASRFEKSAGPMLDEVFALARLNRQLARTRDLLLPRLVTGRLDISEVDVGVLLPSEDA
jgi:type I restriction enzyme S subunit